MPPLIQRFFICIVLACLLPVTAQAQDSLNVRQAGSCVIIDRGYQLAVAGENAYVTAFESGLRIINVSNPALPTEVGAFAPGPYDEPYGVEVLGNHAYLEDYYQGLRIVDVSNPASPVQVGVYAHGGDGRGLAVAGNRAYLANDFSGLRIVDITNPMAPVPLGLLDTPGRASHVAVNGNIALVCDEAPDGWTLADVSNPAAPVSRYYSAGYVSDAVIVGHLAYLAAVENGLRIWDITNPAAPVEIGVYDTPGSASGICVAGNFAFVADGWSGLRVLNISDPAHPVETGFYDTPDYAYDVRVEGDHAYLVDRADPSGWLRVMDCSAATASAPSCPPTALPFVDNFDSPDLDSCWTRVREDTSHWSLTDRPGWLRIRTQTYNGFAVPNTLLRQVPDTNLAIECKLDLDMTSNGWAYLQFYLDDQNMVNVSRQNNGGVRAHSWSNGVPAYVDLNVDWNPVFLRIEKRGTLYSAMASPDGSNWTYLQSWAHNLAVEGSVQVGMAAGIYPAGESRSADFDYFRIEPLPGTAVSGYVSGVWNAAGSPYYVTGDVTLSTGQALQIEPGVEVLFTGRHRFYVRDAGSVQALGTGQDSIFFGRAFPNEESRWAGIEIDVQSPGAPVSRFAYCVIEDAIGRPGGPFVGGVGIWNCSPIFEHCTIRNNGRVDDGCWSGGGILLGNTTATFTDCAIVNNIACYGGGISAQGAALAVFTRCVISGNSSQGVLTTGALRFVNCTIAHNSTEHPTQGSGVSAYSSSYGNNELQNCIVWENTGSSLGQVTGANTSYSDIQGSLPGNGNIDVDPRFVDAASGDYHLQRFSPCRDAGSPDSPLDPDSTRVDMGAFYHHYSPPCPPTPLPLVENFDGPELDSCWTWVREDTSHRSLTDRLGWMRLHTLGTIHDYSNNTMNILLKTVSSTLDFVLETRVQKGIIPFTDGGLLVYQDDGNFVDLYLGSAGAGSLARSGNEINNVPTYVNLTGFPTAQEEAFLRITKMSSTYYLQASTDGVVWGPPAVWQRQLGINGTLRVGVFAQGYPESMINADFDFFRIDSLPGTTVCGEVSGVWDTTGSPYFVNCDITVPAGETLLIMPKVQVLFTGPHNINVFGNLQAIGTEQDSIVFSRAFPTEASRGRNLRLIDAEDTCRFSYCLFEHGNVSPWSAWEYNHGGAIFSWGTPALEIDHCTFQDNYAIDDGGAVVVLDANHLVITHSVFRHNRAYDAGGEISGGAVEFSTFNGAALVSHCVFHHNHSNGDGGAVAVGASNAFHLDHCTFVGNTCGGAGSIAFVQSPVTVRNSIIDGSAGPYFQPVYNGQVTCTFSDITGGYPGLGNIDADPLFVDAANGDFHLQPGSPCVDTGDPASAWDPDNTLADMGAFPFLGPRIRVMSPNGGEQWTLFSTDTVRWSSVGVEGTVLVELNAHYPDGEWDTLAFDVPNTGAAVVFVPEPVSSLCRVRVTALENELGDVSDGNFTITPSAGYLALVRPAQPNQAVSIWNLGSLECPQVALESFRLKNFGSAPITVYRPESLTNPTFARITTCPLSVVLQPGQMAGCDLTLSFAPDTVGLDQDTLRIRTNASNAVGHYVRIPLSGAQLRTPAVPQVVITPEGNSARLNWAAIQESAGGCPVAISAYLVFYSPTAQGSYYYHGYTEDTTYVHPGVIQNAPGMFYRVVASTVPQSLLLSLPPISETNPVPETQIMDMLHSQRSETWALEHEDSHGEVH